MASLSQSQLEWQIDKTNYVLKKADGKSYHYLRPPYGSYNDAVCDATNAPVIYWSIDTRDWETLDPPSVYRSIVNETYDGAIVLVHDIHSTSIDASIDAVDTLQSRGYEFVTVEELITRRYGQAVNGKVYFDAKPGVKPVPAGDLWYVTSSTYLYENASSKSDKLQSLKSGTKMYITKWEKNGWCKASTSSGKKGYVYYKYLEDRSFDSFKGQLLDKAVYRSAPTKEASARGYLDVATRVDVVGQIGGWYYIKTPDGDKGFIYNNHIGDAYDFHDAVAMNKSNCLRTGPSSDSSVCKVVPEGTEMEVINRTGNWYMVRLRDGKTAYTYKNNIKSSSYLDNEYKDFTTVTIEELSCLRKAPWGESSAVGKVPAGTELTVLNKFGSWYKVRTTGKKIAYIYEDRLVKYSTSDKNFGKYRAVTMEPKNCLRTAPTGKSAAYKIVPQGTELTVMNRYGSWFKVGLDNGKTAFIYKDRIKSFVCFDDEYDTFKAAAMDPRNCLRTAPSGDSAAYKIIPEGTELTVVNRSGSWYKVMLDNGKTAFIYKDRLKSFDCFDDEYNTFRAVAMDPLNCLRTAPSGDSAAYKIIPEGTELTVMNKSGSWYKVGLDNGKTAFIYHDRLKSFVCFDDEYDTFRAVTMDPLNCLRAAPSGDSEAVGKIPQGTDLTVVNRSGSWYKVALDDGTTAFIYQDRLSEYSCFDGDYNAFDAVTLESKNYLKKAPFKEAEVIEVVPKDTKLRVINASGNWYKVETEDGLTGFIYGDKISEV